MNARTEHERVAAGPAPAAGAPDRAWRSFGAAGDLDVDFGGGARPAAACDLLAGCLTGRGDDRRAHERYVLGLTLAERIAALCTIVSLTYGARGLEIAVRCQHAECGERFAVELILDDLRELGAQANRQPTIEITLAGSEPGSLRLRRPTGADQRAWQLQRYASLADAERAMVLSLLEGDPSSADVMTDEVFDQTAEAMADADPLPSFQIRCRCVGCDAEDDHPVDLELALMGRLARRQRELIGEVDALARRYGWTEPQVLALPSWRRRAYLERIEANPS